MLSTKDVAGFLQNFVGLALRVIAVPIHQDKSLPAETVAATARSLGLPADACRSLDEALARIVALDLEPPPRILITGSLYLAGEVLLANGTPPR